MPGSEATGTRCIMYIASNLSKRIFSCVLYRFKKKGKQKRSSSLTPATSIHAVPNCFKRFICDRINKTYQKLQQKRCYQLANNFQINFTERNNHANGPIYMLNLTITEYFRHKSKSFIVMFQLTAEMGINLSQSTAFRALYVHVSDVLVIYTDLLHKGSRYKYDSLANT